MEENGWSEKVSGVLQRIWSNVAKESVVGFVYSGDDSEISRLVMIWIMHCPGASPSEKTNWWRDGGRHQWRRRKWLCRCEVPILKFGCDRVGY